MHLDFWGFIMSLTMNQKKKSKGKNKRFSLSDLLVAAVAGFAVLLTGLRLFGFELFTIMSGSMEPTYKTGSLIYVRPTNVETLKEGDVITYMLDKNTVVTHRIVEVFEETDASGAVVRRFRTKGDANAAADAKLVHENNVIGRLAFSLPLLGFLAFYIQRPPGLYLAIVIGTVLLMSVFLPSVEVKKRKEEKIYQHFS